MPHKDSAGIKGEKITSDAITGYLVHALSVSRHLLQRQNLTLQMFLILIAFLKTSVLFLVVGNMLVSLKREPTVAQEMSLL